jgi:hypothetical protein
MARYGSSVLVVTPRLLDGIDNRTNTRESSTPNENIRETRRVVNSFAGMGFDRGIRVMALEAEGRPRRLAAVPIVWKPSTSVTIRGNHGVDKERGWRNNDRGRRMVVNCGWTVPIGAAA